jgi:two-component system, sensor histidine kinase PdtaS
MATNILPKKQIPAAWPVMAIAAALALVLVSSIGLLVWNSYTEAIERAKVRVSTSSQVVSTHIEWLIAAGLQVLRDADSLAGGNLANLSNLSQSDLQSLLQYLPEGISLSLADINGKILLSTASVASDLKPADSEGIARTGSGQGFYISAIHGQEPAARSFMIAKPIERGGKQTGAAILTIPSSVMTQLWATLDLGPGSTVGLMRDDGWLVARHPMPSEPVNLNNYILFTDYLKQSPTGIYETVSPVDGEGRIVGYRRIRNGPLVVAASASRNYVLSPLWNQLNQMALFLIPLILSLVALAMWVARLLKRDELMRVSLGAAVEKNNLLMREIHHRTKNNLQSVASLVKLQPISEEAKQAMSARIAAMSAVHEQAYRSDLYADVNLKDYLALLIGNIARSSNSDVALDCDLVEVTIDRDLAQPLGLVVNEVVSNSMKHAFADVGEGRISIRLQMVEPNKAELVIHDDGKGYDPSQSDVSTGMGSRLIRAFAQQLGNDYSYDNDGGTRFTIRFAARPRTSD